MINTKNNKILQKINRKTIRKDEKKMRTVYILNNEFMGHGDDELGHKLMGAFLKKVWIRKEKPHAIIFYNSAVKLLAEGSMYLDALNGLQDAGVDLIACGTCIDFYGLSDTIKVGRVSGMEEIVDITQQVESVVTI
ncbi:sulfurtransferase-like selenium metabolism protein YedF [Vallitaleaceae bacterium 9-2]